MYKTILVHVDETARSTARAELAAAIALEHEAHLIGVATTGFPAEMFAGDGIVTGIPLAAWPIEELRQGASRALDLFEQAARRVGATSIERRCVDEDAGLAIAMQARYCDLAIIGRTAPDEFFPRQRADFADYVVMHAPRPVLVLPPGGVQHAPGTRVTLAWNGSNEAARAVAAALPLLQRARQVDVVVLDAVRLPGMHGEEPGADIALYLARHGVRVEVTSAASGGDEGASLLALARDKGADLIVMGAYGHSRFREILLGGMTRSLLGGAAIPLLTMH